MMEQPLIPSLFVVRAVKGLSAQTFEEIAEQEGDEPYFQALDEDGVYLVDNNRPRDGAYTEELMERTLGFAIVDSMGRVHKKTKDLGAAELALSRATINFDAIVDIEEDETETGETDNA